MSSAALTLPVIDMAIDDNASASTATTLSPSTSPPVELPLAYIKPLYNFYAMSMTPVPPLTWVSPTDVPTPYAQVLVHSANMTPTLAQYYRSAIRLQVIAQHMSADDNTVCRFVRLRVDRDTNSRVVEFGCIIIYLNALPSHIRAAVIRGDTPFGTLLLSAGIDQHSRDAHYFAIQRDEQLASMLGDERTPDQSACLEQPPRAVSNLYYGRCHQLRSSDETVIADVVEILP